MNIKNLVFVTLVVATLALAVGPKKAEARGIIDMWCWTGAPPPPLQGGSSLSFGCTLIWGPSGTRSDGGLLMEWTSAFQCLTTGCTILPPTEFTSNSIVYPPVGTKFHRVFGNCVRRPVHGIVDSFAVSILLQRFDVTVEQKIIEYSGGTISVYCPQGSSPQPIGVVP